VSARSRRPDPFAALGLTARPDLTDDDVRMAWRRIAAATHPDRSDGGDPERFAAAAAAYTELRTRFGRGEAMADARTTPGRPPRAGRRSSPRRLSAWRLSAWRASARRSAVPRPSARRGSRRVLPRAVVLLPARVRRGRPWRLALRILAAVAASGAAVAVAGSQPAGPALITGALTWLLLTARQDLAPPPG
jgi:curved DNA-binding protein CbpA